MASDDQSSVKPPSVPDHELLRPIGDGSFGVVWLARNALGTYRAIKVIRRDNFEERGPFEREINGIRAFEPVSRMHVGLVDLLQVGWNEAEGYIYAVMELADPRDGGSVVDVATYRPKTLAGSIAPRVPLPYEECLSIGLALTSAVAYLHDQGLIHRDIKPGNVIFVDGLAKLADMGMVTGVETSSILGGTPGYLAPEGIPSKAADVYSLGKVLYEMSTGMDRCRFPSLPEFWRSDDDPERLAELNEIVVRACERDPAKRYPSAREMYSELLLLREGRSVKRLRDLERRQLLFVRIAVGVGLLLMAVGAMAYWNYLEREEESRRRAEAYSATGARFANLGDLSGSLAWLAAALELDSDDPERVKRHRAKFRATLANVPRLVGLYFEQERIGDVGFHPGGRRIAVGLDGGKVRVRDVSTGAIEWEVVAGTAEIRTIDWHPSGSLLAVGDGDGMARIWEFHVNGTRPTVTVEQPHPLGLRRVRFSPDGEALILAGDGSKDNPAALRVWSSRRGDSWVAERAYTSSVRAVAVLPGGDWFVAGGEDQRLVRLPMQRGDGPERGSSTFSVGDLVDLQSLAGKLKEQTRAFDTWLAGQLSRSTREALEIYQGPSSDPAMLQNSLLQDLNGLLRGASFYEQQRFANIPLRWRTQTLMSQNPQGNDLHRLNRLLIEDAYPLEFSRNPEREEIELRHPDLRTYANWVYDSDVSPDGQWVATAGFDRLARVCSASDLHTRYVIPHPAAVRSVRFSPDGRYLLTVCDDFTVRLWDYRGRTEVVPPMKHVSFLVGAGFSPDGRLIVAATREGVVYVWDWAPLAWEVAGPMFFSPDGRRVARVEGDLVVVRDTVGGGVLIPVSSPGGGEVMDVRFSARGEVALTLQATRPGVLSGPVEGRLWDLATGKGGTPFVIPDFDPTRAGDHVVALSQDGSRMILVSDRKGSIWDPRAGSRVSPMFEFDGDCGATLGVRGSNAVFYSGTNALLVDAIRGGIVARLPHSDPVDSAVFDEVGRRLATSCRNNEERRMSVHVWDTGTRTLESSLSAHTDGIRASAFSPDGAYLVTAGEDRKLIQWSTATWEEIRRYEYGHGFLSVAFDDTGTRVVTVQDDNTVCVWDASPGTSGSNEAGPLMPPVRVPSNLLHARFAKGGRAILAKRLPGDRWTRVRDTTPEWTRYIGEMDPRRWEWSIIDLDPRIAGEESLQASQWTAIGAVLSGKHVQRSAERALDNPALESFWKVAEGTKLPYFDFSPGEELRFHLRELSRAESERDAFATRFHTLRALKLSPDDPDLERRSERQRASWPEILPERTN